MTANVCTIQVAAGDLIEGSVAVCGGNARYLHRKVPSLTGWHSWEYTRHAADGAVIGQGVMEVRDGATVTVVCVTVDGALVTP